MALPRPLPFMLGGDAPVPPSQSSLYDNNPEFNASLDKGVEVDRDGNITIAGLTFQASEILYRMDPIAYENALVEYQEQQTERLKELIIQRFPTPLAYHFDRVENGSADYRERLHALQDFWEALIYVLYAIVLGEARCKHIGLKGILLDNKPLAPKHLRSDKLADRLTIIAAILEHESQHNIATQSLDLIPLAAITQIRQFNQERNEFAHNETMSEEEAEERFKRFYPDVLAACQLVSGLADVTFMRYQGGSNIQNSRFEYFVSFATNRRYRNEPLSGPQIAAIAPHLHDKHVIVKIKQEYISVSPFLHYVVRENGRVTKLCGFKRKVSGADYEFRVFGEFSPESMAKTAFDAEDKELDDLLTTPPARGNNP